MKSRIGWGMTALFGLFMLGASVAPKFLGLQTAVDSLAALGWEEDYLPFIGIIELVFTLLFFIPRTALLGATLMTGLLGGAMSANIRAQSPLFSHTLFSIYLGVFMWVALWLRDQRVRRVFPFLTK